MDAGTYPNKYSYIKMGDPSNEKILVIPGVNDEIIRSTHYPLFLRYHFRGLTPEYRVIVTSRKKGLETGKTTEDFAEDYRKILEQEGNCHVLGVSLGGMIAQQLATKTGDVDRLVLGLTAAELSEEGEENLEKWIKLVQEERYSSLYREVIDDTFSGPQKILYKRIASRLGHRLSNQPNSDLLTSCKACIQYTGARAARSIDNKTLIIGAKADSFFPENMINSTAQKIGAETKYIPGKHAAFYQKHSEFHDKVLRFLSRP
ncbi:MAG: alpha/beta fold hydrolase [Candidatus Nanohalobium sp.]